MEKSERTQTRGGGEEGIEGNGDELKKKYYAYGREEAKKSESKERKWRICM